MTSASVARNPTYHSVDSSTVLRRLSGLRPRKSGRAGNRNQASRSVVRNSDHFTTVLFLMFPVIISVRSPGPSAAGKIR
jgi:hypothetical protein